MDFLEKDLEQIIWESDNLKLQERGLEIYGKKLRQLRIGSYGIADLVTCEKKMFRVESDDKNIVIIVPYLHITVYELKKEKAGISAFLQALKYCRGIKTYLEKRKQNINFKLNIVLCAKQIDTQSDYIFLSDLLNLESNLENYPDNNLVSLRNYSFKYDINGLIFKEEIEWDLQNKGF